MVVPTITNNAVTAKMAKSIVHLLNTTDLFGMEVKNGSCICRGNCSSSSGGGSDPDGLSELCRVQLAFFFFIQSVENGFH